jgi:hypothetical protein
MTLAEFKAWFDGFTEDMEGAPSAKQWKRIKARVAQIDGVAITREVVYHRYWPTIVNNPPLTTWLVDSAQGVGTSAATAQNLVDLGKAEYSAALS